MDKLLIRCCIEGQSISIKDMIKLSAHHMIYISEGCVLKKMRHSVFISALVKTTVFYIQRKAEAVEAFIGIRIYRNAVLCYIFLLHDSPLI